ncbi:MAG TPA: substrate-binding domain-containing protein [Microcoleaceae cyanobacterium]
MDDDFNYIKCPKCEHDRNPSTAVKCEICGTPLRKSPSLAPILGAGLAALVAIGAGTYLLRDKIPGLAPQPDTSPTAVTSPSEPTATPSASSQPTTSEPLVQGAVVKTYHTLAEVPNVPQGRFNYGGSTVFAPLRSPTVLNTITATFPQFQLRYTEPTTGNPGSGKGIEMLLNGQLSFAQSSRSVKEEEYAQAKNRGVSLEEVPVAIDGIALFINPQLFDQGVKGLSLAQIQDIFTGKIQNWSQVGGPNVPIVAFSRDPKVASDFFHENVLEKQPLGTQVKLTRDATEAIRQVASTPGGISYATASESINQQTIRLLGISKSSNQYVSPCTDSGCTAVNDRAFTDGSYPITRRLFVVIKRDGRLDEQAGVAYANILLSDEGQQLIQKAGFVSIR